MSFTSLYRVDNVPWWLWPAYTLVTYSVATVMFLYLKLCKATCPIEIIGREKLESGRNYIYCAWHEFTWVDLIALSPFPNHVWLNHPQWYMRPVHIVGGWIGVEKMVLGSSGYHGREAADELVRYLRAGKATVMMPDGPYGPKREFKKGALHLSHQTGIPLVGIRTSAAPAWHTKEWDQKVMPIPFRTRIRLELSAPYIVQDPHSPEESAKVASLLA